MAPQLGLDLADKLSFDEWERIGQRLVQAHKATPWMLGDWLLYGEFTYGSRYAAAADACGLERQTLRVFAMVSGHFHPERRRAKLSFDHHRAVVPLGIADQERLLDAAERLGWTRDELRGAVNDERRQLADDASTRTLEPVTVPAAERAVPAFSLVEVRAEPSARTRWEAAAAAVGVTLDAWIAAVLDTAAANVEAVAAS